MRCEHCGSEVETREIPLVDRLGKDTGETITGQVVGPFLVHGGGAGWNGWRVTHIATGGVVTSVPPTKLAALDIAAILAEHPEQWGFTTVDEAVERRELLTPVVREAKARVLGPAVVK